MPEITAREAMARADAAHAKIESHEDLCAERYNNIHGALNDLKKIVAWGGSTVFGLLVVVLGWLAVRAISTNDAQFNQLQNQVQQMQAHERPAVLRKPGKVFTPGANPLGNNGVRID